MQKNEILSMTCDSLGSNLEGVCHYDGQAVFVPGLLPGETAQVRIVKVQQRFAYGITVSSSLSSKDRRENDCPAYPQCGGCSARHMSYAATLAAKQAQVQQCFHSIAHIDTPVEPVIGMSNPFHYRNKSSFPISGTRNDPALGFYAPRSHRLIPIRSCPNAMEPTDAICDTFLSWMRKYHLEPYCEENHRGLLRHLVIRVNRKHESMVTLVATSDMVPHLDDLQTAFSPLGVTSLIVNVNSKDTNVILGDRYLPAYGPGVLQDELLGLSFDLSPASFFQVNVLQAEQVYSKALEFAQLQPDDTAFDVYCGTGTISLSLAKHCRRVIGIEVVPQAIDNAKLNAEHNGLHNTVFHVGKAEDLLPSLVKEETANVIVVDPPRKGLEPIVIDAICAAGPDRLVYVSCNPATLARDVALIVKNGYTLSKVQPVDMFCWTKDVETVVLLSKGNI